MGEPLADTFGHTALAPGLLRRWPGRVAVVVFLGGRIAQGLDGGIAVGGLDLAKGQLQGGAHLLARFGRSKIGSRSQVLLSDPQATGFSQ